MTYHNFPHGRKLRANLPKRGKRDDAQLASTEHKTWQLIKNVIKAQGPRLERAMTTQHRWTATGFELLFVRHPLMTHLAQRLI